MNKRQKLQLFLAILFGVLLIFWIIFPGKVEAKVLGIISCACGILSMVLSYRAEEKIKKKDENR